MSIPKKGELRALTCISNARHVMGLDQKSKEFPFELYKRSIELFRPFYPELSIADDPDMGALRSIWLNFADQWDDSRETCCNNYKKCHEEVDFYLSNPDYHIKCPEPMPDYVRETITKLMRSGQFRRKLTEPKRILERADVDSRLKFCSAMLDGSFNAKNICFTDESEMFLATSANIYKVFRLTSDVDLESKNRFRTTLAQVNSIKVFVALHPKLGIVCSELKAETSDGDQYRNLLTQTVIPKMKSELGDYFNECWFQQNEASAHTEQPTLDLLKSEFGERVMSDKADFSSIQWPTNALDLNPLDYWFWPTVKKMIKRHRAETFEQFRLVFNMVVSQIKQEHIDKVMEDFKLRLLACREVEGEHFEDEFVAFKYRGGYMPETCEFCKEPHGCKCHDCLKCCMNEELHSILRPKNRDYYRSLEAQMRLDYDSDSDSDSDI